MNTQFSSNWRQILANRIPMLGNLRRWLRAVIDTYSAPRSTYAQNGEDQYVEEILETYDLSQSAYIDVGANHPTSLSNTYRLYRRGIHGLTIEPNPELLALHRKFRPRDIVVGVGCGQTAMLGEFQILSTPVLGGFSVETQNEIPHTRLLRKVYIPILPLDLIAPLLPASYYCFVSIDTEGQDEAVLLGAGETLKETLVLCVEANSPEVAQTLSERLNGLGYELVQRLGCNLLICNRNEMFDRYRKPIAKQES